MVSRFRWSMGLGVLGAACLAAALPAWLEAQQGRDQRQRQQQQQRQTGMIEQSIVVPDQGLIQLSVITPEELRLSQSFDYTIEVTNVSDEIPVYDVQIAQHTGDGFHIESSQLQGENQNQANQRRQQSRNQRNQSQQSGQASDSQGQDSGSQASQNQQQRQQRRRDRQSQRNQNPPPADDQEQQQQQQSGRRGQNPPPIEEESVDQQPFGQSGQNRQSGQQQSGQANQGQSQQSQSQQGQSQRSQRQQGQGQQQAQGQQQGQSQQQSGQSGQKQNQWTIPLLRPGETRTIQVTATSDQEGRVPICATVKSYNPAACIAPNFVKPDLEIVKQAPDRVPLCEPFELAYFVKNAGTGDIGRITLRDPLPDGLLLANGEEKLEFQIEGLSADEVRKFTADVIATRPGEFSSRAEASRQGEQARSQQTTTTVVAADLAVDIRGPQTVYINRPAQYEILVTNQGNAAADDVNLAFGYPADTALVQTGDPQPTQQQVTVGYRGEQEMQQQGQQQQGQQQQQQGQQQVQSGQSQNQQAENRDARSWNLGTLQPGESRRVTAMLRPDEANTLELRAIADFPCEIGDDRLETRTRSVAFTSTEVISLPALMLTVMDQQDPVATGDEVTYVVKIGNEGTAPDSNIRVEVEVPEQLEFVDGSGTTQAQSQNGTVSMQPIEQLQPGEVAEWQLRFRVTNSGEARLKAILNSEKTQREATAEEPTRLFGQQQGGGQPQGDSGQNRRQNQQDGQNQQGADQGQQGMGEAQQGGEQEQRKVQTRLRRRNRQQ